MSRYASWQGTDGSWELGPSGWKRMDEQLYTIPQAAALKGVSRQAVHLWLVRSGKREQCERFGGHTKEAKRPWYWLIPASVLEQYTPDPGGSRTQIQKRALLPGKEPVSHNPQENRV